MSTEVTPAVVPAVWTERRACRGCDYDGLEPVLDLGNQYLPRWEKAKDETLPRAPLVLSRCTACGLLQLGHSVDPDLLYRQFWYRSAMNATMREAMTDLVKDGLRYHTRGSWLDIGANDGYLLSQVPATFAKVACEPALNFRAELEEVSDLVVSDYFSHGASGLGGPFQVITSAAMFYDLNDPDTFVDGIEQSLAPDGVWINQLNDAPGMIRQNAFDSICHEHACYYDIPTLRSMYDRNGLIITGITYNQVNGGSVRLTAKRRGWSVRQQDEADILGIPGVSQAEGTEFAQRAGHWKERMHGALDWLAARGPLYGYGASTKGTVLLQYLDAPGALKAVADKNPLKFGTVMAGSWLPVVDEETMRRDKPSAALVLPWAFKREFVERETDLRRAGTALVFPLPSIEVVI